MSNKTPENNTAAIASAPNPNRVKTILGILCVVVLLIVAGSIFFIFGHQKLQEHQSCLRTVDSSKCLVRLEYAMDPTAHAKGLSDRTSMPLNSGMAFIFDKEDTQCFWMKDMKFHIDMIWFNAQKKIVHIEPDVAPETYPATFCPKEPAQYVIELNSGEAQNLGLHPGQQLSF